MKQGLKTIRSNKQDNGVGAFSFDDFDLHIGITVGGDDDVGEPILDHILRSDSSRLVSDSGSEQALDLDLRQASDDIFSGLSADGWEMDLVAGQSDPDVAFDLSEEYGDAAFHYLSVSKRSKRSDLITISEADFEGPQLYPFRLLKERTEACYAEKISTKKRMAAIEWVFCPTTEAISFDMVCRALGMRASVWRTRIHYEFYGRWQLYPAFPFLTMPVPADLDGEILYLTGEIGQEIAKYPWRSPGISYETIMAYAGQEYRDYQIEKVLIDLERAGIIGMRMKNVYLIGRNPEGRSDRVEVEVNRKTKRIGFWSTYW